MNKSECKHSTWLTHSNGVRECLCCYKLFVFDCPELRKLYDYPQFDVEWLPWKPTIIKKEVEG